MVGTLFNILYITLYKAGSNRIFVLYKHFNDITHGQTTITDPQNPRLSSTPIDELKAIGKDHGSPYLTECSSSVKAGHSPLSSTPGVHSKLGQHSS